MPRAVYLCLTNITENRRKNPKLIIVSTYTCKVPKNTLTLNSEVLPCGVMPPKDAVGISNSEDPDQTLMFATTCLSENSL